MDDRYKDTQDISKYILDHGYTLRVMWECDFKALHLTIPTTYYTPTEALVRLEQRAIIQAVEDELIFGLVTCDIHVPDLLKPYFEDLTPIFKNTTVTIDDIGPTMQAFCRNPEYGCSFKGELNTHTYTHQ